MAIVWDATTFAEYYDVEVATSDYITILDDGSHGLTEGQRQNWSGTINGLVRTGHEGINRHKKLNNLWYYRWAKPLKASYGKLFAQHSPHVWWQRAKWLIARLESFGLNETHRVLIVGSTFGYLIHAFHHASDFGLASVNFPNVWGMDIGNYVEANYNVEKLSNDEITVFDDISDYDQGQSIKNKLTAATGDNTFHVIVSEDVLGSFSDGNGNLDSQAGNRFLAGCESALIGSNFARIIHIVSTDPITNISPGNQVVVMSAQGWWGTILNSRLQSHTVVDVHGSGMLGGTA